MYLTNVKLPIWPSDAICCQKSKSTSVNIMTSCLFGAKPLPKPLSTNCQMDSQEKTINKKNCNKHTKSLFHKNAFEIFFSKMLDISVE